MKETKVKELKVKLSEDVYEKLRVIANGALRSINKQVTFYVLKGMESDVFHSDIKADES